MSKNIERMHLWETVALVFEKSDPWSMKKARSNPSFPSTKTACLQSF